MAHPCGSKEGDSSPHVEALSNLPFPPYAVHPAPAPASLCLCHLATMGDEHDEGAAMAAMGLPSTFAAPSFPRETARGASRPPPPGPSNRGARGRDGGWRGRGAGMAGGGRGGGAPPAYANGPPPRAPTGPAAMRGGHQTFANSRGGGNKRKRGGAGGFQRGPDGPLPPLEEIRESIMAGSDGGTALTSRVAPSPAAPVFLYRAGSVVPSQLSQVTRRNCTISPQHLTIHCRPPPTTTTITTTSHFGGPYPELRTLA